MVLSRQYRHRLLFYVRWNQSNKYLTGAPFGNQSNIAPPTISGLQEATGQSFRALPSPILKVSKNCINGDPPNPKPKIALLRIQILSRQNHIRVECRFYLGSTLHKQAFLNTNNKKTQKLTVSTFFFHEYVHMECSYIL